MGGGTWQGRAGRFSVGMAAAGATRAAYQELRRRPPAETGAWLRVSAAGRGVERFGGLAASAGAAAAMGGAYGVSVRQRLAAVGAALAAGACAAYDERGRGGRARGSFRARFKALGEGRPGVGGVRLLGIGAAGLAAGVLLKSRPLDQVLAGVVIAGAAHSVNLLDTAPGRAAKAVVAAGAPGLLRHGPGAVLAAAPVGAAAAVLRDGIAQRTRLGHAGAHALGAALGAAIAVSNGRPGLALHAGAVVALTAAGDRISAHGRLWNAPGMGHVGSRGRGAHPFG